MFYFQVERLTETWVLLRENNEFKYNLFRNLNEKYTNMLKGEFYHIEQEVSMCLFNFFWAAFRSFRSQLVYLIEDQDLYAELFD